MVNEIGTQNVHLKSEGVDWWIKNICAQKEFNYMSIVSCYNTLIEI